MSRRVLVTGMGIQASIVAALLVKASIDVSHEANVQTRVISPKEEMPDPVQYCQDSKKSKGEKRRDRAERRRKGW